MRLGAHKRSSRPLGVLVAVAVVVATLAAIGSPARRAQAQEAEQPSTQQTSQQLVGIEEDVAPGVVGSVSGPHALSSDGRFAVLGNGIKPPYNYPPQPAGGELVDRATGAVTVLGSGSGECGEGWWGNTSISANGNWAAGTVWPHVNAVWPYTDDGAVICRYNRLTGAVFETVETDAVNLDPTERVPVADDGTVFTTCRADDSEGDREDFACRVSIGGGIELVDNPYVGDVPTRWFPDISKDGAVRAYSVWDDGAEYGDGESTVTGLVVNGVFTRHVDPDFNTYWTAVSASGQRVAYLRNTWEEGWGTRRRVEVRGMGWQNKLPDGTVGWKATAPALSGNGRFLVFGEMVPGYCVGNDPVQVRLYRRDLLRGQTKLVTENAVQDCWNPQSMAEANGHKYQPAVSYDGRTILFTNGSGSRVFRVTEPDGLPGGSWATWGSVVGGLDGGSGLAEIGHLHEGALPETGKRNGRFAVSVKQEVREPAPVGAAVYEFATPSRRWQVTATSFDSSSEWRIEQATRTATGQLAGPCEVWSVPTRELHPGASPGQALPGGVEALLAFAQRGEPFQDRRGASCMWTFTEAWPTRDKWSNPATFALTVLRADGTTLLDVPASEVLGRELERSFLKVTLGGRPYESPGEVIAGIVWRKFGNAVRREVWGLPLPPPTEPPPDEPPPDEPPPDDPPPEAPAPAVVEPGDDGEPCTGDGSGSGGGGVPPPSVVEPGDEGGGLRPDPGAWDGSGNLCDWDNDTIDMEILQEFLVQLKGVLRVLVAGFFDAAGGTEEDPSEASLAFLNVGTILDEFRTAIPSLTRQVTLQYLPETIPWEGYDAYRGLAMQLMQYVQDAREAVDGWGPALAAAGISIGVDVPGAVEAARLAAAAALDDLHDLIGTVGCVDSTCDELWAEFRTSIADAAEGISSVLANALAGIVPGALGAVGIDIYSLNVPALLRAAKGYAVAAVDAMEITATVPSGDGGATFEIGEQIDGVIDKIYGVDEDGDGKFETDEPFGIDTVHQWLRDSAATVRQVATQIGSQVEALFLPLAVFGFGNDTFGVSNPDRALLAAEFEAKVLQWGALGGGLIAAMAGAFGASAGIVYQGSSVAASFVRYLGDVVASYLDHTDALLTGYDIATANGLVDALQAAVRGAVTGRDGLAGASADMIGRYAVRFRNAAQLAVEEFQDGAVDTAFDGLHDLVSGLRADVSDMHDVLVAVFTRAAAGTDSALASALGSLRAAMVSATFGMESFAAVVFENLGSLAQLAPAHALVDGVGGVATEGVRAVGAVAGQAATAARQALLSAADALEEVGGPGGSALLVQELDAAWGRLRTALEAGPLAFLVPGFEEAYASARAELEAHNPLAVVTEPLARELTGLASQLGDPSADAEVVVASIGVAVDELHARLRELVPFPSTGSQVLEGLADATLEFALSFVVASTPSQTAEQLERMRDAAVAAIEAFNSDPAAVAAAVAALDADLAGLRAMVVAGGAPVQDGFDALRDSVRVMLVDDNMLTQALGWLVEQLDEGSLEEEVEALREAVHARIDLFQRGIDDTTRTLAVCPAGTLSPPYDPPLYPDPMGCTGTATARGAISQVLLWALDQAVAYVRGNGNETIRQKLTRIKTDLEAGTVQVPGADFGIGGLFARLQNAVRNGLIGWVAGPPPAWFTDNIAAFIDGLVASSAFIVPSSQRQVLPEIWRVELMRLLQEWVMDAPEFEVEEFPARMGELVMTSLKLWGGTVRFAGLFEVGRAAPLYGGRTPDPDAGNGSGMVAIATPVGAGGMVAATLSQRGGSRPSGSAAFVTGGFGERFVVRSRGWASQTYRLPAGTIDDFDGYTARVVAAGPCALDKVPAGTQVRVPVPGAFSCTWTFDDRAEPNTVGVEVTGPTPAGWSNRSVPVHEAALTAVVHPSGQDLGNAAEGIVGAMPVVSQSDLDAMSALPSQLDMLAQQAATAFQNALADLAAQFDEQAAALGAAFEAARDQALADWQRLLDGFEVQGEYDSYEARSAADGEVVAFGTAASTLVEGDTNQASDVYLRHRSSGTVDRVSVGPGGAQSTGNSRFGSITPDGRFVAFYASGTGLVPEDDSPLADVYVRDMATGTLELVNRGVDGAPAPGAESPTLSADGRYVLYLSRSSAATAPPPPQYCFTPTWCYTPLRLYLYDRTTGETELVSRSGDGTPVERDVWAGGMSADAETIVFTTASDRVVADDVNGFEDVYVFQRSSGSVYQASLGSGGQQPNGASDAYGLTSITPDGQHVIFYSRASNLAQGVTAAGLYVHDTQTRSNSPVVVLDTNGAAADIYGSSYSMSGDARWVAFVSDATLVSSDTNGTDDVFRHDRQTGTTEASSVTPTGATGNDYSYDAALSPDGTEVIFASAATNLVEGDTNGAEDIFSHNHATNTTTRVSTVEHVGLVEQWQLWLDEQQARTEQLVTGFRDMLGSLRANIIDLFLPGASTAARTAGILGYSGMSDEHDWVGNDNHAAVTTAITAADGGTILGGLTYSYAEDGESVSIATHSPHGPTITGTSLAFHATCVETRTRLAWPPTSTSTSYPCDWTISNAGPNTTRFEATTPTPIDAATTSGALVLRVDERDEP